MRPIYNGDYLGVAVDRGGLAVQIDRLVDEEGVDSDVQVLSEVDDVILEAIVGVGSSLLDWYLSRMKTERAAACMFLTAEMLKPCSVDEVFSKMSVT